MSVTDQTSSVPGTAGNGSSFTYSFSPMVIFSSADLEVVTTVVATGVETARTEGTGSTNWSLGITTFPATGSITYPADEDTALTSATTLTIRRKLTLEQQTVLGNQGGYLPKVQERAFDKLTMMAIQQQNELDRSLKFPVSYTGSVSATVPAPLTGSRYLRINAAITAMEWVALATATASASDSTPQAVSVSAAAAGTAGDFARDDHVHLLSVPLDFANHPTRLKTAARLALYNHVL